MRGTGVSTNLSSAAGLKCPTLLRRARVIAADLAIFVGAPRHGGEVELAIVIGKPCVDVSQDLALDYVAGYAAFNDISARDVIRGENKSGIHLMGKSFPGFAPMGPYLITADEIPEPQNLKLNLSVNGEKRQESSLNYMIFKIPEMIAYWSQMGLHPGDVLTTGTPRGVAAGRKPDQPPWWLKPGDVVEAEVENVGRLRNRIVAE